MKKTVLGLDTLDGDIQMLRKPIVSWHTHSHMFNEMLFYDSFDGYLTVNQENIDAADGSLLLITPTDFHSTTINSKDIKYCTKIAFRSDFYGNAFTGELNQPMLIRNYAKNVLLAELRNRCEAAADSRSRGIILNTILLELTEKGEHLNSSHISTNGIAFAAIKLLNERFNEEITLDAVAKELHVSPQYLSATFSKHVGLSFSSYLREKRLNYAASLLIRSEYNVTDICFLCGFRNLSHFIRSFENKFIMSPMSFRKKQHANLQERTH